MTSLIDPCIASGHQDFIAACHVPLAKKAERDKCWSVANFLLFIQFRTMPHRLMSIVPVQSTASFY